MLALATAVAGGLTFATGLTLILTPSLLMLGAGLKPTDTKIQSELETLPSTG